MSEAAVVPEVSIRQLDAAEADARLSELAAVLVDAVAHGAAVHFLPGFTDAEAKDFWRVQLQGLGAGEKRLYVGELDGRLIATVMLSLAQQPNQPHRAEIGKMLVHSSARRRGLGRRLLTTAEAAARQAGRSLLMLDTETDSAGHALYRSNGWTEFGRVPDFFIRSDGELGAASFFYKQLA